MTTEVVPGAPAPAPTPAAPTPPAPAPEPAPAPPAPSPEVKLELEETPAVEGLESTPVTYDPTGSTSLDMALEFVGNLGFGPEHAAMKAAEAGDFAPLRDALKKLGDKAKGFERYVKLGEEAYAAKGEQAKAAEAKMRAEIVKAVGGAENWEQIRTWASANATPEEKAEVNAAFKAGGIVAKTMAKALYDQWAKNADREPGKVQAPGAKSSSGAADVLTKEGYLSELQKLATKFKGDLEGRGAKEYKALQDRRTAAMRIGR